MAKFVYIDESGSVGSSLRKQPYLTLVAAIVDEDHVQPLSRSMRAVAMKHLGWYPTDFEFHGREIWNGSGYWASKPTEQRMAAYEAVLDLLNSHAIDLAHSTIDRVKLNKRHAGVWDDNAWLLALQFLLEKIDMNIARTNKILVADEEKKQQVRAIKMVADMQSWSVGEVPGHQLQTVIDSLHFVSSHSSPGVQMADLVAFIRGHRRLRPAEGHPEAEAGIRRLLDTIEQHTITWRQPWPT